MSKDSLALAYAIKQKNKRKQMAEGGEVKEKSWIEKAADWADPSGIKKDPKDVKDPISMSTKNLKPMQYAEGGEVESGDILAQLMHKRKMLAMGGMAEDEMMPIDHDSAHEDFLSDEDDQSANLLEGYEGKDEETIDEPHVRRKAMLSKMMGFGRR